MLEHVFHLRLPPRNVFHESTLLPAYVGTARCFQLVRPAQLLKVPHQKTAPNERGP